MPVAARRPEWLKVRLPHGEAFREVKAIVENHHLHTVCESAHCPNMAECWGRRTATFMILGDICTRSCRFCAVKTGRPTEVDELEPFRVADAVRQLNLKHAVITSVNRDELKDGGAHIFAETIRQIRKKSPGCRIEVLIPDFQGDYDSLKLVIDARPDILNHNVETIPRLYKEVRPQAKYDRSLWVLEESHRQGLVTKSGLMVGLGETPDEVLSVMRDLRKINCDILTIGQYLQPTKAHLPVDRFVHPNEFQMYKEKGLQMGFRFVESGPLVRSSYHADEQVI